MASSPAVAIHFAAGAGATDPAHELLIAALDDYAPLAVVEDDEAGRWVVHFPSGAGRDAAAAALGDRHDLGIATVVALDVPDEDWARRSQSHLSAVRVGGLTIAPPWDVPAAAGASLIVIDPSTGFGTGHHQTTRLCLRLLQSHPVHGARVVDVGTGSGVLAIAAARLGAREVVAVDCDPDALDNARSNIARNGVGDRVTLVEADLSRFTAAPARLVTANLTASVLQAGAGRLRRLVEPGGTLVASGFGPAEARAVTAALGEGGEVEIVTEDEWVAAAYTARDTTA